MTRAALFAATAVAALAAANAAGATRGVALDLGRLDIAQTLTPGGGYRLPVIGVRNPATPRRRIAWSSHTSGPEREGRTGGLLLFSPSTVTLKPGETRKVAARLSLPTGGPRTLRGPARRADRHEEAARSRAAAAAS